MPLICIGANLHKLQVTVCAVYEETGELVWEGVFKTNPEGYEEFCKNVHAVEETTEGIVEIAV